MSSIYSTVETLRFPRSRFVFRNTRRSSYNYGKIYPCYKRNMTPGETIQVSMQAMIKAQPMAAPSMTPQRMDVHFFFVPYRLLDDLFCPGYIGIADKDITYNGVTYHKNEEFPYQFPIWSPTESELKVGGLWDYFGFGINVKDILSIDPSSVIPESGDINQNFYLTTNPKGVEPSEYIVRAYNLIYNTMYRDENLIDEVDLDTKALQYRSYRPDYFTKALPFQQLPSDVTFALPFQITTSLSGSGNVPFTIDIYQNSSKVTDFKTPYFGNIDAYGTESYGADINRNMYLNYNSDNQVVGVNVRQDVGSTGFAADQFVGLGATQANAPLTRPANLIRRLRGADIADNLAASSSISQALTVQEVRNSFQLLKEAERTARTGHRFDEYIKAHWGEFPGDARMQLPEFVGGFKVPIIFGESLQTSATTSGGTAQGNRVGIGNAVGGNKTHWYHCTEPGVLLGLASILPRSEYMQGVPKMFQLHDRLDFPRHEFCSLSEQQVKTGELVLSSSSTDSEAEAMNNTEFGFQGIYNEYRTGVDETVGQMRTIYQYWHQTRIFDPTKNADDNKPSTRLNKDFVEASNVSLRTYLNTDKRYDPFNVEELFVTDTIMPITKRAVPGLTDHY